MKLDKRYFSKLVDQLLDKAYYVKPQVVNGKIDYESCFTKLIYSTPVGGVIFDKDDDTYYWGFSMVPLDDKNFNVIGISVQGTFESDYTEYTEDFGWYRLNQKQLTKLKKVMDFWKQKYPDPYFLSEKPYWEQKLD